MRSPPALGLISSLDQAAAMLEPTRLRLLGELVQPDSASGLARRLGLPRQRVNYHLRELEKVGLVEPVEERRKGNCVERIVRSSAATYLISPDVLGSVGADPSRVSDRASSSYLVAVAAKAIAEVAEVRRRSDRAGTPVATLTLQAEVRFATGADRKAFAEELANEVARLVAEYHDESAPRSGLHRFYAGGYPALTEGVDGQTG